MKIQQQKAELFLQKHFIESMKFALKSIEFLMEFCKIVYKKLPFYGNSLNSLMV
jgi:hypothetical protein